MMITSAIPITSAMYCALMGSLNSMASLKFLYDRVTPSILATSASGRYVSTTTTPATCAGSATEGMVTAARIRSPVWMDWKDFTSPPARAFSTSRLSGASSTASGILGSTDRVTTCFDGE